MKKTSDRYIALHTGEDNTRYMRAVNPPVFLTSLHTIEKIEDYNNLPEGDFLYGRYGSPNEAIVEAKLAGLEGGKRAFVYPSGMGAATAAILAVCHAGCHVICVHNAYGPVQEFLSEYCAKELSMDITFVHGYETEEIERAIRPETALLILESPGSTTLSIVDLRACAALAKEHGFKTYVDNSCCTPVFQKPLSLGIDIVMHSATKYLGGHSDILGGALVTSDDEIIAKLKKQKTWFGGVMGPMEAWLLMRGLRTLSVRMPEHQKTAMEVAKYLENSPKIRKVYYPGLESHPQHELALRQQTGFSGLLSFEIDGTVEKAMEVTNRTEVFQIGPSWGGFESLIIMPLEHYSDEYASWYGASRNLIRIHCGLEGAELLIEDLEQALSVV